MRNDFLEYYGEHHISPVKQDISDIDLHYERRKKLYRQCGIPTIAFRNAEVLEVGPGSGYNTLAFFQWDSRHVDLVEANPWGRADINKLFEEHKIPRDAYNVFSCKIEDYQTEKKYDIIVAEGFLQNLYNQQEVIAKLQGLVRENGIIVITCCDHVCFFIEAMKRLVGWSLAADISDYNEKVDFLVKFFEPQLVKLKGVSKQPKDWVQDQILDSPNVNGTELSIIQAIEYFGEKFDVLGSSPQIFTDYSWYKDIWFDYKKDFKEQFKAKRLSLLMANMPEMTLPISQVDMLVKYFENIKRLEQEYEQTMDKCKIGAIIDELDLMESTLKEFLNNDFVEVFYEIRRVLLSIYKGESINMNKYPHFFAAFGRTQQYLSFVKR